MMSAHVMPRKMPPAVAVGTVYWAVDALPAALPRLRPLSALDQMYAYWGSDNV